ncbi:MAG: alpha/beta hydrolase [Cyclobacteriaceae bacterium]
MLITFYRGSSQTPKKAETVRVNGTDIYYEVYGKGEPLFLLHAFTESTKSWASYVSDYANDFEVYVVDLKGHGKSAMFTEKFSMRSAAEEIDALVKHLNLNSINAIGFSYGGELLFQLALLHPGLIKSMIVIGACGSWDVNDYPDWIEYLSYKNIKNLPWMREQQTSEEQIKAILAQMPNFTFSVTESEMKSIQAKTLFVLGDQDSSIPLECISSARKNLPKSYLWIVPKTGHSAHRDKNKADFVKRSKEFFSDSWAQ